jgi:hypothetical protein
LSEGSLGSPVGLSVGLGVPVGLGSPVGPSVELGVPVGHGPHGLPVGGWCGRDLFEESLGALLGEVVGQVPATVLALLPVRARPMPVPSAPSTQMLAATRASAHRRDLRVAVSDVIVFPSNQTLALMAAARVGGIHEVNHRRL